MNAYPLRFEEDDRLRSAFIRDLTLQQLVLRLERCDPSRFLARRVWD
jgi:hypothetical protein